MTTITTTLTWRDNELFAGGRRMGWAVSLRPPVPKWQAGRLFQGRGTRHDTEAEARAALEKAALEWIAKEALSNG